MEKSIIISPYSRGPGNAKNYPFWPELCELLTKNYKLIQVGKGDEQRINLGIGAPISYKFDLPLPEVEKLLAEAGFFIAVDNMLHHMAHYLSVPGIVLWGPSDPELFGYKDQVNIIKDRSLLRKDQFGFYKGDYKWEHATTGWYPPEVVITMGKVK